MSCNKQLSAVASSLGSSGVSDLEKRPFGYWTDISNLERELNAYIDAHGTPGVMPGLAELTANGRTDLICAFRRFGGTGAVARRLRLIGVHHRDRLVGVTPLEWELSFVDQTSKRLNCANSLVWDAIVAWKNVRGLRQPVPWYDKNAHREIRRIASHLIVDERIDCSANLR